MFCLIIVANCYPLKAVSTTCLFTAWWQVSCLEVSCIKCPILWIYVCQTLSFKMYLLTGVSKMNDLLKIGNARRESRLLNWLCLENVHEGKMKASNNEVNIYSSAKRNGLTRPFCQVGIPINNQWVFDRCSVIKQYYSK